MFKNLNFKNSLKISNFKFQIVAYSLIGLFVYLFIGLFPALAQTQGGIEVSPSTIQLDFATDKPQTTLTYTNHTNQTVELTFSTSDVTQFEDSYKLEFLSQKDAQNFKYGLSSWIEFSNSSLVLSPNQKGTITVFIDKDKLSPGGHYGSILAHIQTTNISGNVAIKSILATLVFVRTHTGKEYEKGNINSFDAQQNFFDFPKNFLLRFTNSGDTYFVPYGQVSVYSMWGNFIGKGIVNTGSLLILPESLRRIEIPVQPFATILLPGIYHADIAIHFGKTNQKLSSSTTFFSFGNPPLLWIGILLVIIGSGYVLLKRIKRDKRVK